jgi:hypothetical protein
MNNLLPSYEPQTGQVVLEGLPAGAAGEAMLAPAAGLNLAFDRADGHLARIVVDVAEVAAADQADTVGAAGTARQAGALGAAVLARLFGSDAPAVLRVAAGWAAKQPAKVFLPDSALCTALSRLARLDAARATSPVPGTCPRWAAEAAELAERAGLHERARAETAALERAEKGHAGPWQLPTLDVAAEVESLKKDQVHLPGLHWVLDPAFVPKGLFRFGLSPHSDLSVRSESGGDRLAVRVQLLPGADRTAVARCVARLVDPAVRRVLASGCFSRSGAAELALKLPLGELDETWLEVADGTPRPVLSVRGHRIRQALRWGDAALRAERAPRGLAPAASCRDWAALAVLAWERCRWDWEAVGDADRAFLAARRQAAIDPRACGPVAPSATAATLAALSPPPEPGYLAESQPS